MDSRERARKLWDKLSHEPDLRPERTVNVIAAEFDAVRAEMREEAARACYGFTPSEVAEAGGWSGAQADVTARRIRALKERP